VIGFGQEEGADSSNVEEDEYSATVPS